MSKFLVSIGHFAQPSVIELQAKTIRANCGADTPILLSDDHTETAFDEAKGVTPAMAADRKAKLLAICERENLIYRDSGPDRIGHAGGDLGAFYHGLIYARDNGIDYVWKLSQRFVIDRPNWLQESIKSMGKFGAIVSTRPCFYSSRAMFAFRTECIGLKVLPWIRPDVLNELRPRRLHTAAEFLIEEQYARISGGKPFLATKWLPRDRLLRSDGIAWKDALPREETDADYRLMAEKYGVSLGDDFNINHSCIQPGFQWG